MANDLATLSSKLSQQLRDVGHEVWTTTEKDDLIRWSVASLYPRFARYFDPSLAGQEITLVSGTYFYAMPSGMREVSTLDLIDAQDNEMGPLDGQTWHVTGDWAGGTQKIRISPRITDDVGGVVRVHGYGPFDTTTNLIPDDYVPLVMARARAEAYRRMAGDRVAYTNWMARNQKQNVSVNELVQLTQEAEVIAQRLLATTPRTWRRPVPGRLG